MSLRIKGKLEKMPEIELDENTIAVIVRINGDQMAAFYKDGSFSYFGKGHIERYEGRWDK